MKKDLTELVFILDRSGSMSGLEADTIGGFNSMIAKQKKEPGEAFVSTVLFDSYSEVIHDRLKLENVPVLTEKEYQVCGCTALLDAIGGAIHHIANIHQYARPEDVSEHTMLIIRLLLRFCRYCGQLRMSQQSSHCLSLRCSHRCCMEKRY